MRIPQVGCNHSGTRVSSGPAFGSRLPLHATSPALHRPITVGHKPLRSLTVCAVWLAPFRSNRIAGGVCAGLAEGIVPHHLVALLMLPFGGVLA